MKVLIYMREFFYYLGNTLQQYL